MADSRAPGFLTPLGQVLDDDELLDALQPIVVGIGGWPDPSLVRPSWQSPDMPNQPEYPENWCALRIARTRPDTYRFETHVADGQGYDVTEYSEELDLMLTCYGPRSQSFARTMRDGFQIAQNRQPLQALDMDTLFVGEPVTIPILQTNVWVRRVDVTVTLRRVVERKYGVLTILELPVPNVSTDLMGLNNEKYITPIIVEAP